MYAVSQRYLDTLARSHEQYSYLEILQDGDVVATLYNELVIDPYTQSKVQNIGGSISVGPDNIRRSGSVNIVDASGLILPDQISDLLAYVKSEIRPWVGLRYWDATPEEIRLGTDKEFVPIGTLVITGIQTNYPQITISGYDRMWLLNSFPSPYVLGSGVQCDTALIALLSQFIPSNRLDYQIPNTDLTTGKITWDQDTPVSDAVAKVATTAGWQLYVDPMGTFIAQPEPNILDDPVVIAYGPGIRSMMMRPSRTVDASSFYNAVVFTGEPTDGSAPVRGYAEDTNPESITYVGSVGARIYFASSPLVKTTAGALLGARTTLLRVLGIPDTITVPIVPNYALEGGDIMQVTDLDQNIDFPLIADSFECQIRAADGGMSVQCRNRVLL
jgi:hypothetical protein